MKHLVQYRSLRLRLQSSRQPRHRPYPHRRLLLPLPLPLARPLNRPPWPSAAPALPSCSSCSPSINSSSSRRQATRRASDSHSGRPIIIMANRSPSRSRIARLSPRPRSCLVRLSPRRSLLTTVRHPFTRPLCLMAMVRVSLSLRATPTARRPRSLPRSAWPARAAAASHSTACP